MDKQVKKMHPEVEATTEEKPTPKSFTIVTEDINELTVCMEDIIKSPYVKQVLYGVLNKILKPNF